MNVFLKLFILIALRAQSVILVEQNDAPAPIPVPREKTLSELHKEYFQVELRAQSVIWEEQNDAPAPIPVPREKTLSELHKEYFDIEKRMWERIENIADESTRYGDDSQRRMETSFAIAAIHKEVFFAMTFEQPSYWRSYLILGIEGLRDNLAIINSTLDENYGYLYDVNCDRVIFDALKIDEWTREAMFRRLKNSIDGLFDITSHSEYVLRHIQREAKCCTQYVTYVISEQQLVREYYANVGKAMLRGHAMAQLAYMLLALNRGSDSGYSQEAEVERNFFLDQYEKFQPMIDDLLKKSSRDLWKCNPNPYMDNHNYYTSITNFMQGYIDNVINLNPKQQCSGTCAESKLTKNYGCYNGSLCAHPNFQKTKCSGEIFDCDVIDADGTACLVKDEMESRRYNFLKLNNGTLDGHDVMCFEAERAPLASWSSWLVNQCSNCFCFCDDATDSDRYFSLRNVVSDIHSNKIITGIAFRKLNRVIQFVISERELFGYGRVDTTHMRKQTWKNESIDFLTDPRSRNGIDYHTLTREHRSINLDTVNIPTSMVLTGVRLQLHDNRLMLEVRGTEFDFHTGHLKNLDKSIWFNNVNGNERTKVVIDEPDAPTRTKNIQERYDFVDKYVEFGPSDIRKDLAQVTVPYIESVYLEAREPRPLAGAGLFYKGEPGYGGFVAIKLVAYDIDDVMKIPR